MSASNNDQIYDALCKARTSKDVGLLLSQNTREDVNAAWKRLPAHIKSSLRLVKFFDGQIVNDITD